MVATGGATHCGVHAARGFDKMGRWSQPGTASAAVADPSLHEVAATVSAAAD
jgi:hypothetical protein